MSPPRRRSARLRGSDTTPRKNHAYTPRRLSSLLEGDETPVRGPQPAMDGIPSSPHTPATGRVKPSLEEMHPSLAHQSTAQKPDSGLRLGFIDVNTDASTRQQSGNGPLNTPSKVPVASTFDFRFARPPPDLGPEAQRMMDDLREEALRIKAKLAAEREEEKRKYSGDASGIAGRRFAQPKSKVGRFSDVHMAEFKKMDSIAGHPSSFRAQPGRIPTTTRSLKRSQSKAKLDDREDYPLKSEPATLQQDRLKDTMPAKRARKELSEDSTTTKQPTQVLPAVSTPSSKHSRSDFLEHLTTPTQSSLARASSIKSSQIPTLSGSPSKLGLMTPGRLTKSATTGNLRSVTKSILRRPESSSIPTLKTPSKADLNKELPSVPGGGQLARSQSVKRVNFTPTTKDVAAQQENSPSPVKTGLARSKSNKDFSAVKYPPLPVADETSRHVTYPSLSPMRGLAQTSQTRAADTPHPPPSVPDVFTFRSDQTISFGASPGQASLRHVRPSNASVVMPGSFPGTEVGHKKPLPAISHGMTNKKRHRADSIDEDEGLLDNDKENTKPLPNISHGMSNKKRHRAGSDDEREESERSPKKHKGRHAADGDKLIGPQLQAKVQAEKSAPTSRIPSPAKKGGLTLSRLNMLARPKNRK